MRTPTWGYNHKSGEAKVFNLDEGENLPTGWADKPKASDAGPSRTPPHYERVGVPDNSDLRPLTAAEERKLQHTQPVAPYTDAMPEEERAPRRPTAGTGGVSYGDEQMGQWPPKEVVDGHVTVDGQPLPEEETKRREKDAEDARNKSAEAKKKADERAIQSASAKADREAKAEKTKDGKSK